ncbi:MAG: hypothetical protein ACHQII_07805, partial [Bacteroidia bacterium]
KEKFVNWLLQISVKSHYTIVLEYSRNNAYSFLKNNAIEVQLPVSATHEYNSDCKLTAIINPNVTDNFVRQIISETHVLSIHNKNQMVFLIADDFHDECFSGTGDFFIKHKTPNLLKEAGN